MHADHLNTPRRLTDASQAVKWQWPYSGFGEINPQSTPAAGQAPLNYGLRYPGQIDDGNGLFYNWHRFYDPRVGRYTSSDPIGLDGGWNRFGYVGGNPLGFVDPEGLRTMPNWWENAWRPITPPGKCATAECAAGQRPAPSENKSPDEISRDLRRGTCEFLCGVALPLPRPPFPKDICEVPARAIEEWTMGKISGGICSWICK